MIRFLYTLVLYLSLPFIFLRLLWRSRKLPGLKKNWRQRLGFFNDKLPQSIWLHAVSVGESIAAIPLLKLLKEKYPDIPIIVTNMTATGRERINAALGNDVLQSFVPYDIPNFLQRFIKKVNPKIIIVMETEIWPNLFHVCFENKIPIILTNARLSERSFKGYKRIANVTLQMLNKIKRLVAQTEDDAKRFVELGMSRENIIVTGNLKFDLEIPQDIFVEARELKSKVGIDRLVWVAASTHEGEEEIILIAHKKLLERFPDALLILVPRHPNRFKDVAEKVAKSSFKYSKRSKENKNLNESEVYLCDTMGELMLMYAASNIAFVGGSFSKLGGHNMLEPASLHKPILTGPSLFNFKLISDLLLESGGMLVVKDSENLVAELTTLFQDENQRCMMGEKAYNVIAENKGALLRQFDVISSFING